MITKWREKFSQICSKSEEEQASNILERNQSCRNLDVKDTALLSDAAMLLLLLLLLRWIQFVDKRKHFLERR